MSTLEPSANPCPPPNGINLVDSTAEALQPSESAGPVGADVADVLALPRSKRHSRIGGATGSSYDTGSEGVHGSISETPGPASRRMVGPQKPSPWWILIVAAFSSILLSMTLAPKTEVYIRLVCERHQPDQPLALPIPHETHPASPSLANPGRISSHSSRALESTLPAHVAIILTTIDDALVHIPRPSSKCTSDPEIGRIVAGLSTAVNLTLGILSLITTGYWASYSDRVGRKPVLRISALASLSADIVFIMITLCANKIPTSYNLFVLCSAIYGIAGGLVAHIAAAQSYCSDCADSSSRARLFSIFYGMWFAGIAVGPTIGGLLITATNDMLSVFYVAAVGHTISAAFVWFIVPESLSPEIRAANSSSHAAAKLANNDTHTTPVGLGKVAKRFLFGFLIPLRTFLPRKRDIRGSGHGDDWNLTFIGLSSGISFTILGMVSLKFQYAEAAFGWNSETLGYYLTGIGVTRAIHLAVFLPLIIRIFGPKKGQLHDSDSPWEGNDPSQPLLDESQLTDAQVKPGQSALRYTHTPPTTPYPGHVAQRHGHRLAHFNLIVARVSVLMDLAAFILISLSKTGPQFYAASMLSSCGAGFTPATQALALHLMPNGSKDAGKLFGAIGMVGALSTQVVGPSLFGIVYMITVSIFPRTIFVVGCAVHFCTFIALAFVRLP